MQEPQSENALCRTPCDHAGTVTSVLPVVNRSAGPALNDASLLEIGSAPWMASQPFVTGSATRRRKRRSAAWKRRWRAEFAFELCEAHRVDGLEPSHLVIDRLAYRK
jgi:hypothetical protein